MHFFIQYFYSARRIRMVCQNRFTVLKPTPALFWGIVIQQQQVFCLWCQCHVLRRRPPCAKLHPISYVQTEIFHLFAEIFSISMLCNTCLSVENSSLVAGGDRVMQPSHMDPFTNFTSYILKYPNCDKGGFWLWNMFQKKIKTKNDKWSTLFEQF